MRPLALLVVLTALGLAACGLDVQAPDVFQFTRVGEGRTLTLVVNNAGFARCNGGAQKAITSKQLIAARDLAINLENDAQKNLSLPRTAHTVYMYALRMQQGRVRFPDTAGEHRHALAEAELYFVQAMQGICHISA